MDKDEMALVVSFPDDSQSFANGFEAGMLWTRLEAGESPIDTREGMPMRAENQTVFLNMALHHQYVVDIFPTDEKEWWNYVFTKRQPLKHLSLVKD